MAANDNIANAEVLSGTSGTTTGNNVGATLEANEADCLRYTLAHTEWGFGGGSTVWYVLTAPGDGRVVLETSATGSGDIVDSFLVAIDGNDFSTATVLAEDDDRGTGTYSKIVVHVTNGQVIYIAVDGYNGDATDDGGYDSVNTSEGNFQLAWAFVATGTHDDVADRYPLIQDGEWHEIIIDTTDATNETNESPTDGLPGKWLSFTDTGYYASGFYQEFSTNFIKLLFDVERLSGDINPVIRPYKVTSSSWDEESPDFDLLDPLTLPRNYYGKSGWAQKGIQKLKLENGTVGDIWYLYVGDIDGANQGVVKIRYKAPPLPDEYIVDALDDPNTDSPTVATTGDSVTDTQTFVCTNDTDTGWGGIEEARPTFFVRGANLPPPGQYYVEVKARISGSFRRPSIGIKRNGIPLNPNSDIPSTNTTIWQPITYSFRDWPAEGSTAGVAPPVIPITSGDELAFCLWSNHFSDYPTITPEEILQVKFTRVGGDPGPGPSIEEFEDEMPLGSSPGNVISADLLSEHVYYNASYPNRSGSPSIGDLTVMPNGDIYVLTYEQMPVSSTDNTIGQSLVFFKYTAVTNSWEVIDNDVWGHGHKVTTGRYRYGFSGDTTYGNIAICNDGENVYCVWGERDDDLTLYNYWQRYGYRWRCKKWDGASFTELGTGQTYYATNVAESSPTDAGHGEEGLQCKCGPNGDIWVTWTELSDGPVTVIGPNKYWSQEVFIARWNGSSWDMDKVPDPPSYNHGTGTGQNWFYESSEVTIDQGIRQVDITFCHHDGPSDTPSVLYMAFIQSGDGGGSGYYRAVYTEFDGASFNNTIDFGVAGLWAYNQVATTGFAPGSSDKDSWWQQGMALCDDGTKPWGMFALGDAFQSAGRMVVFTINSDGDPEAVFGFPDDEQVWQSSANDMCIVKGRPVCTFSDFEGFYQVYVTNVDDGTDRGWCVIAKKGASQAEFGFSPGANRLDSDGKFAYVLNSTDFFGNYSQSTDEGYWDGTEYNYFASVWKLAIKVAGKVADYNIIRLR